MHLLAVDPGGTTGIAIYYNNKIATTAIRIDHVMVFLDKANEVQPIDGICVEKFATAGRLSKYGLETIDLVGQIKGWAFARNIDVTLFVPQSRKAWQVDDEPTPHQADAKAHLMHFMRFLNVDYE